MNKITDILRNLRNNKATEQWGLSLNNNTFSDNFLCSKVLDPTFKDLTLERLDLSSFQKMLLEYGDLTYESFIDITSQYYDYKAMSNWSMKILEDLKKKLDHIEFSYFDNFDDMNFIQDIENGTWVEELDSIIFDKNLYRELSYGDYYINFNHPNIKSISRQENTYVIETYTNNSMSVIITTPAISLYEINANSKSYTFEKTLSIQLPKAKDFVVRNSESLFVYTFKIISFYEYLDEEKNVEKSILFQSLKLKENKDEIRIYLEGDNSLQTSIEYRLFDGVTWSDYKEYKEKILLYDTSLIEHRGVLKPLTNHPYLGIFDKDLSSLYSSDYLFVPKQSIFLQNIDNIDSWTIDYTWKTNFYAKENTKIDIGNFTISIDNIRYTGSFIIPAGLHTLEVNAEDIYIPESIDTDIYYPYNIFQIFTKNNFYPNLFTIAKAVSKFTSMSELLYSSDLKPKYSFNYDGSEFNLLASCFPEELEKKEMLFLVNKKTSRVYTHIQFRIVMDKSFKGSIDSIGVVFR